MVLKGRLKLISDKTPISDVVCDIGTDHAYIPINLINTKRVNKAIATDVKKGPIVNAIQNIKKYGLEHKIETRIGCGLKPLSNGEFDSCIIAGMGGMLISQILKEGIEKINKSQVLIIQPMNAPNIVRKWLFDNGFQIFDEEMVREGEKMYTVIVSKYTGTLLYPDEFYYYIGENLIKKKDPLLNFYVSKETCKLQKIISNLNCLDSIQSKLIEQYTLIKGKFEDILKIK